MNSTSVNTALCLGFLSIRQDGNGSYLGGYLVLNRWGRPLEFRLTTTVQPNRIQQILYSGTLLPYLCGDLIGKTLLDKTAAKAKYVFTDHPAALDLRLHVDIPVSCVSSGEAKSLCCHPQYPQDEDSFRHLQTTLNGMDLSEPFLRVREVLQEAQKLGVTHRG